MADSRPIGAPASELNSAASFRPEFLPKFLLPAFLFLGTLLLYAPTLNHAFLNYDDPSYVTSNPHVLKGLTLRNAAWALTATVEANWHPLTWMSHMIDVQMFGLNPRGHHAVSIVLHGFNVLLLFFVLVRATGFAFRSTMVAALFAVHPLNVECVAWVAERKSLLSMFFCLLTLLAYQRYSERRTVSRYAIVIIFFALGLACKPMIVTLPLLLLLCDYWPLQRFAAGPESSSFNLRPFFELAAEKAPLLALSAASSWITLYAQRHGGALGNMQNLSLGARLANAVYSYAVYFVKGIWPSRLAVFYPHPEGSLPAWKAAGAALLLIAVTVAMWLYRERHRYLLTGWLWYLLAMVPMIGIVQVGRQAMADRYAYLPFIGLFVIGVWGCAELCERLKLSITLEAGIAVAIVIVYASITFLQISYWRNSYTLFSHAVQVTDRNGVAEDNLGVALTEMGRPELASPHFLAAAEYVPQLPTPHYNLGVLYQKQRELDLARAEYELTLRYSSDPLELAQSHSNLGFLLLDLGDNKSALDHFTSALQIDPEKQNSLLGRGMAEYRAGNLDGALADFSHAAQIAPSAQAEFWLGRALEDKAQFQSAITAYQTALQLAPGMADAQERLNAIREKTH